MRVKAALLNKESKNRRVPRGLPEDCNPTLSHVVMWLMTQCGRPQTECRHQCMVLVYQLTSLLPGRNTPATWMANTVKERGAEYFVARFEGGGHKSGIQKHPLSAYKDDQFTVKATILWLEYLLAALDSYVWVLNERLLTPTDIFRSPKEGKRSNLFKSIDVFLVMAQCHLHKTAKHSGSTEAGFSPREEEDYDRSKCTVLIRLFDFMSAMLGGYSKEALEIIPSKLWTGRFAEVLCSCVLKPTSLGFNMADTVIMNNLPHTMNQTLGVLYNRLPTNLLKELQTVIHKRITASRDEDLFSLLPTLFSDENELGLDHVQLQHIVLGYKQLQKAKLLTRQTMNQASSILDCVMRGLVRRGENGQEARKITPSEIDLGQSLLELAFQLGVQTNSLIDCMLDSTPIVGSSSRSVTSRLSASQTSLGILFLTTYKQPIMDQLVKHGQDTVYQLSDRVREDKQSIGMIVYGLLEHAVGSRDIRKRYGMAIYSAVLTQWDTLSNLGEDDDFVLNLIKKVLQIDFKFAKDSTHPAYRPVFNQYLGMLRDTKKSLAWKTQVLDVLYFFASVPEKEEKELKSALDLLVANHFPLKSTDLDVGSPSYNDYIMALNKILTSLVMSQSLMLLELIISILCRDEKHSYEDKIQGALSSFAKRLPPEKQSAAANIPFEIFKQDRRYSKEIRKAAIQRVCIPLLRQASRDAMVAFYKGHIHDLVSLLEARLTKNPVQAFENQLVSKICYFELIEVLYSRLNRDDLHTKDSALNREYCHGKVEKGNEMSTALTKASLGARNEDCRGETIAVELRRQFHCAAFNCCAAIISCVQDNVKFFNAFIFSENLSKGQFLLDNLVDPKKEYNFAIEADAPVERKKRFVAIRSQAREANAPEESGYVSGPAHYLSSQYLSDSSLSEDVNQFDFSSSIRHFSGSVESQRDVAGGSQGSQGSQRLGPMVGRQDSKAVFSPGGEYLEMEEDALNQHECMAAMTGVLKHMTTNKINPDITKATRAEEMPTWMSDLQKKLSSPSTEYNIKLFIIRLIINTQDVFQPYAKFWLTPLMQFLATARVQRDGMNYMVMDIMLVMLDWSTIAVPEDGRLASGVLRFLMENSYHERKSVMKNNLEVIKTLVECWKGVITVPTRVIYEKLQDRSPDKKDSAVGIHLLAVILANKLQPLSPTCDVDPDRFYSALASNIDNKYKAVHGAAAEVIGMAMKQMAETDQIADGHLHEVTYKQLHQLQVGSGKEVIFITCLHKIHLNYPVFTDRFMNKLLFMLPSIHGQPKTECLQIITARIEHIDNAFIEMKNKNILALLTHKDEADQLTSLKLVDGMLPKLQPSELLHLLPAVKGFVSHPSPTCRDAMYSILMWIYDNYREEDRRDGEDADKALSIAKDTLLQGLSDQENYLRLRVSNFWSHETRLPKETLGRLIAMLRCMYSPSTENRYLGYATNLLLEMTSKSPDFKREIFEHPLSACKFEEVQIDHSWRQRHAAISTPKFVETQVGQSQGSMRGSPSSQSMGMGGGQLRATQATQQFAPTQENAAASRKNAYNWLTGSQDTFADYSSSSSSASESSLLFTMGSLPKRTDAFKSSKQDTGAGGSRGNDTRKAPSEGEKEVQRLKRRFLKDQSSQSAFFAKRATRQKQLREEVQRSQRERRFAQVTMYRQYRSGDLPDIQIKHSDIIAPLQALALRDSTLSRLLFCALFRGIFARIGDDCTEREAGLHVKEIETHLNQMLNESNQFDPAFISCILEIGFYHSKQLTLDPAAISQSSLTSRQLLIGIRVLEEVLIKKSWDDERSRKRARTSRPEQSQEMKNWIELARLYKAMGEFDVLRGIFGSLIETKDVTHKAIQAESRGDYEKALKLYSEAISSESSQDVTQEEEDFWDEARLQCCNQLTKWDNMEAFSTDQSEGKETNDFSDLWNDSYKQEIYLPCMIRSKLKMLLEGSDDDSLTTFIDSSAKNQERRAILESRYTEELAALSMLKEDYNRAKYYLANCTSSFLQEWSGLGPLMLSSRLSKLQDIQKLTEAEQFLQLANKPFSEGLKSSAIRLLSDWSRNLPDPKRDPISVWDDVTQYRCLYMDKLCNILGDSPDGGGDTMETTGDGKFDDLVRREKVLLSMKMADSACQQSNFFVATKHLKSSHRDLADFEDLKPAWTHSYVSMIQRKALLLEPYERITSLLKTLEQLGKLPESQGLSGDLVLLCDHRILTSNTYQSMATALQDGKGEILKRLSDEGKLDKLLAAAECQEKRHEKVCQSLFKKSKKFLDEAVGTIKKDPDSNSSSHLPSSMERESMAKAHMTLVSFSDQLLRQKESENCNPDCLPSLETYPTTLVISTLQAMKLSSTKARQHFPRLLQIVEQHPDTIETLIKEASSIPSWMFIGWISQMVALLDKPESLAVQEILKTIAEDYPQALVYPFKISSEDFKLGDGSPEERQRKDAVKEIDNILSKVSLVDNLTLALQRLTHPGFLFKDWVEGIKPLMDKRTRNPSAIKREYQKLYQQLFESGGRRGEPSSSNQTVEAGPYWKKVGREYQKRFDSDFGKDGSKLASMDYKTFVAVKQKIYEKMNPGKDDPGNLKEYSPWFTAFQSLQGDELEIPGQYDGSKKPLPAYHVKIAGFEETVITLPSIRKPKCIKIRGDDETDYPFLVKVGEDLRMDQRIEQLYCIMNGILAQDAACSQRGLTLKTYQVIPMTSRLGILEWVKNTTTLKDFITRSMTETERNAYRSAAGPLTMFAQWVRKFSNDRNPNAMQQYAAAFRSANETETVKAFREREAKVPWDLLRRGFMELSASPEAFLTLRAHFARSHTVLCICQYILGIGDRHLSNFLISLETGGMVGIDFGHSFGSATQFLPIPELVPFRLTRQIVNLMLPMKIEGVLQSSMVHTLRALRQDHELLLNTMDVFIKEPSLDWKGFADKQANTLKMSEEDRNDESWYPKEKINLAKMKLQGANPTFITKEELKMGHSKTPKVLMALTAICRGTRDHKRALCDTKGLRVEDQVACLIDQATDPHILGITWQGWEPWV
ncbi:DNA-dependent protein kinase catalytic subunit-like [Lytechinus pictus]|uniref:DNA-dependent protein kinase catalytic subunit-like n=1 Tax=Lytechinus pictus TaxID=7653 RepID=UPI0030BA1C86